MEQWQREGIDRLERLGYLQTLRGLVKSHTAPLWWFRESGPVKSAILHNGTVTFVDTRAGWVAVTALHVYEEYTRERHHYDDVTCQVGNVRVVLEEHLLDTDARHDLATFAFPDVLVAGSGAVTHGVRNWPPDRLYEGELVVCGGYPGKFRKPGDGKVEFAFVSFIGRVTQASEAHASIYLDIPNSYWPQGEALEEAPDLGGTSGGPVFRVIDEPIERLELAGFIYEYGQTFEIVLARHADLMRANGSIRSDA